MISVKGASFGRFGGWRRRYPGGSECRSIFLTVSRAMPNRLAASRWLRPSTWQASRTRRYRSTVYILPPSISKKIEGYRWQSFTPPAAGKSRRFRGLICHRRSHPRYNRDKLRYPSDLTDAEWAHIEPLIPPGKPGGGKRRVAIREVINGVMYILSTGCQWRALPKDLPPRSTVHDYLGLWNWDGTLDRIHHALYLKCREKAAREASPTACIIDSQSVKSAEKGGLASTATASMPAS